MRLAGGNIWLVVVTLVLAGLAAISVLLGSWVLAIGGAGAVIVGAVVLARRPNNGVGLALFAFGAAAILSEFSSGYMTRVLEGSTLPLQRLVVTMGASVFALVGTTGCALLLVYPTGRARGRWRWVLRVVLGLGLIAVVSGVVWSLNGSLVEISEAMMTNTNSNNPAELAAAATFMLGLPLSVASLITRYRAGSLVERAQIRWLLFAASFLFITSATQNIIGDFDSLISQTTTGIAFLLFPIAVGVAVTRYRLFEIDRIISRTVSYALVVGILGLVFATGVVWLPGLLALGESPLVVAGTTLVVAALFNPVRKRVQGVVDRRFNRARYDAERVIDGFSRRLRDEMEVTEVGDELQRVAAETVHPSTVSLWLPEPPRR